MNEITYIILFTLPSILVGLFLRYKLSKTYTWKEFGINMGVVCLVSVMVFAVSSYSQLADVEIRNGEVVSKTRDHDHYVRSYDCNCRTVCTGSGNSKSCREVCQTCYEDRYTVTWSAKTTVGSVTFQHLDRDSKSVYASPDPSVYKNCNTGDPASLEFSYTNYVKAAKDSLFNTESTTTYPVPQYPRVHNYYKVNRVINVGTSLNQEVKQLNALISESLKTLGKKKQVNVIVLITENDDPTYRHDVENAWVGGKKNDVVLFIGVDGKTITWVDVMTFGLNRGNELFTLKLRDSVQAIKGVDVNKIDKLLAENILNHYDRPQMSDYEYLKDDIQPPSWLLIVGVMISLICSLLLTFYFHRNDI